jgi:hypothetical protein
MDNRLPETPGCEAEPKFGYANVTALVEFVVAEGPGGHLVREGGECLGIDVQAPFFAPGDKQVRAHIRLDGDSALALEVLNMLLSGVKPIGKSVVPAASREE